MCGIAGVFGTFDKKKSTLLAEQMISEIVHRGPDESGVWAEEGISLGMTRLSIIDIAGGHQPMVSKSGVVIVYNGEIYNYKKLRDELIALGYCFQTKSDTEVLLNLYCQYGIKCLDKLQGMFAACIYDRKKNKFYIFRDRLGVKPLYYYKVKERFYFGSELKSILKVLDNRPGLDKQAIHHYLTLRYIPTPLTPFLGVCKLEAGHYLEVALSDHTVSKCKYWSVRFESEPFEQNRDYDKEFSDLFLNSVESRLLAADVPVGLFLSGGLDSSAIAAAAVELGHKQFHTFCVGHEGIEDKAYDETAYARLASNHFDTIHHEIRINRDSFIDFLPEYTRLMDEPLADLASLPVYFMSKNAREYVKVVLSGEGADEVLAGYDLEKTTARFDKRAKVINYIPAVVLRLFSKFPTGYKKSLIAAANHGASGFLKTEILHMTYMWTESEKNELWKVVNNFKSTDDFILSLYSMTSSSHATDQVQDVYCQSWLVDNLLMRADKMTMAASLELRVPFLDHSLIEWAAKLPIELKTGSAKNGYITKRILRKFCVNRVPYNIIHRKKQGFPQPVYEWLQHDLNGWAVARLNRHDSPLKEIFSTDLIMSKIKDCKRGLGYAHHIWLMLILDYWLSN